MVERQIVQLMMKYREVMKAPGRSRPEKERDFILLLRNKLLNMDHDFEEAKICTLMRTCHPFVGKIKKGTGKDAEILDLDEVADLHKKWPTFNINITAQLTMPKLCDRMLMEMHTIPSYMLRLTCCDSMNALRKFDDEKVDYKCKMFSAFTDSCHAVLKSSSFTNLLRGTVVTANYLNHVVELKRMNLVEKMNAKPALGFDIEDCLKVGTNFYECMEWQDNNKKNSVLEYVVGFLAQNKTEGQGIDIKELEALQTTLTKCLKQKMWNLEKEADAIEHHINVLMRSVGQLKDFEDVVATDANMPAHRVVIRADKAALGLPAEIDDNFHQYTEDFLKNVIAWKDKFKQERCAVYQACFLLRTHVCKKDSSATYDLYLKEPEENYKMPTGERDLRLILGIIDMAVLTYNTTQGDSVYVQGAKKAGL